MNSYNEVRQALDPVVGVPFRELSKLLGITFPADPRHRRQAGGDLVEALLEIAKNSIPKPDLVRLGTEVKTIPLNTLSRPREWTKITSFNADATKNEKDFRRSSIYGKLRSILFVPVMKVDNAKPDFWYLRPSFLWLPTDDQLARFEVDYDFFRGAVIKSDWARLSARFGQCLTLNTSSDKTAGVGAEKKGRAWWLKANVTREICDQNLWPREAMASRKTTANQSTVD